MKYFIAQFARELPVQDGLQFITTVTQYQLFKITEESLAENNPFVNVKHEEVTEIEGEVAWKFYGESRPYRSAYSDIEGLEPDPESLAVGKRKTKVYYTEEITNATLTLMKRVMVKMVEDEFDTRSSRDGEQDIINVINSQTTIRDLNIKKEELLGIEMNKSDADSLGLWNHEIDSRHNLVSFSKGF